MTLIGLALREWANIADGHILGLLVGFLIARFVPLGRKQDDGPVATV